MKLENLDQRRALAKANRIVIKVGSMVLVDEEGKPNMARMRSLVSDLTQLHQSNKEIVLVTSGAIAVGVDSLHMTTKPNALPQLQMAGSMIAIFPILILYAFTQRSFIEGLSQSGLKG